MKRSFEHYLTEILPFVNSNILCEPFSRRPEKISELFSRCSSNYILEISLEKRTQIPDLSICILKSEINDLLKHWGKQSFRDIVRKESAWGIFFDFCSAWNTPTSELFYNISNIWFEFDSIQLEKAIPSACFFFSPISLNKRFGDDKCRGWLFDFTLPLLFPRYISNKVNVNLSRCIDQLPQKGAVFQIGIMAARDYKRLRLCTSMPVNDYLSYLEKIGWPGNKKHLDHILSTVTRLTDHFFLDIDAGEDICPGIGIECCFNYKSCDPEPEKKIKLFLEFLIKENLCLDENAKSILMWLTNQNKHSDFPLCSTPVQRTLSHFKLSISPDLSLKAKSYLSFSDFPN